MKIGIDALKISAGQASGIENYLVNLLKGFEEIGMTGEIKKYGSPVVINENFTRHFMLPHRMDQDRLDLAHFPDHILPLWPLKAKKVITVHDLAFKKYPQFYNMSKRWHKTWLTPGSIKKADKIIAVSSATKGDLIDLFGTPEEKIKVIHNGIASIFKLLNLSNMEKEQKKKKYGFKRLILFVGTIEPRKNLKTLIEAFDSFVENEPDLGLIVCGKKGWLCDGILNEISDHKMIRYLDYVPTQELVELYNLAEIFVYPSFYEGFGFPPLEAMACGTPVITSNTSSLPEVTGDAALLVDPADSRQIAEGITRLLNDKILRDDLIQKGLRRVKTFSWKKTAEETWKLYQEVIKHG